MLKSVILAYVARFPIGFTFYVNMPCNRLLIRGNGK